jgi:hypothetical protein
MTKFVIHWNHERIDNIYFMAVEFKSRHTDTYGSAPEKRIHNTAHLSEAMLFDTREAAENFIALKLHDTNLLPGKISEVTDKELFKARLSDNKVF